MSDDRRARELTGVVLWALAAAAWVAAMLVPWFRAGVLAHTSPLEIAELLRSGVFGIPPVAGFAVLLLPACALVLLGLAPLRGTGVMVARVLLWLVATVVGGVLLAAVSSVSAGTVGWGAALVLVACVLGAAALCCATVRTKTPDQPAYFTTS